MPRRVATSPLDRVRVFGPGLMFANGTLSAFNGDYGQLLNRPTIPDAIFKTIAVSGQDNVVADSATDTLTLVAGSNMTLTTNAAGDSVTFAASGGISVGTSNPVSPNDNDLFYRTDLDLLIFYNGTRWLTVNQFALGLAPYTALPTGRAGTTAGLLGAIPGFAPDYDFWMEEFRWTSYVQTTNSGVNFWQAVLTKVTAPTTETTIVTGSTAADAASTYTFHKTAIGALLGTTPVFLRVNAVKQAAPGTLDLPAAAVIGRVVIA